MSSSPLNLVFIGLSITSSWGNGHATTFRALIKSLARRGHAVTFLEYDAPWYSQNRDMPDPPFCETHLYKDTGDLKSRFTSRIDSADAVIVGSYVNDGVAVGQWVQQKAGGIVAYYDIDTPVTLAKLERSDYEYLSPDIIPGYNLFLSFSGGATLDLLTTKYGSPLARPLYCSVDPELYYPETRTTGWDLGYLGTYSDDRQPGVEALLLTAARQWSDGRFVVAGPQYPDTISWPGNVERIDHMPPHEHRQFYNSQRFTLNITRADMIALGHSPSVRLFEAAACGVPIISDYWTGLEEVLTPGTEIITPRSSEECLQILRSMSDSERIEIGERAHQRVMASHTSDHRAAQLEQHLAEAQHVKSSSSPQEVYAAKG